MIEFFVPGNPVAQGSKKAFFIKSLGRAVMTEACSKLKPWRSLVSMKAEQAMGHNNPFTCPVAVVVTFSFNRPKGHFGTGKKARTLKADSPVFKTSKPDVDKLLRGMLDAMTGIVYSDDSLVAHIEGSKVYSHECPGAFVSIKKI